MDTSSQIRQEARQKLCVYMSRTGATLHSISFSLGENYQTLRQFSSGARFGNRDGLGERMARRVLKWLDDNPAALPELPGKLYESHATRTMDKMLDPYSARALGNALRSRRRAENLFVGVSRC